MNLRRVGVLVSLRGRADLGRLPGWALFAFAAGAAAAFMPLLAEESEGRVRMLGVVLRGFSGVGAVIQEYQGYAWVAFAAYLWPAALLPLAASFGTDQTLWVRLTPTTPLELMVARIARFSLMVALPLAVGVGGGCVTSEYHGEPWGVGLTPWLGFLAHLVLAAGLILVIEGMAAQAAEHRSAGVGIALALPVLLFAAYSALPEDWAGGWSRWWPYAMPFFDAKIPSWRHSVAAGSIGLALMGVSLLFAASRFRRAPHTQESHG